MKILAFSDLHDDESALGSLSSISSSYDYIFGCGDLSSSSILAEDILSKLSNAFLIPGNSDSESANAAFSKSNNWIHKKRVELREDLNVVGFGYSSPTPFGTYGELSESQIMQQSADLPIDRNTLLMLHCPPRGYFDFARGHNIGSDSLLHLISVKKPKAAFFGHAHEHVGTMVLGDTLLIKLPPANTMRACSVSVYNKKITVNVIEL